MSLFPAYAQGSSEDRLVVSEVEAGCSESLAFEAQLLASDNDDEREVDSSRSSVPAQTYSLLEDQDYYLDCKLDVGNLWVSTLYYPGRPQYEPGSPRQALGAVRRRRRGAGRARRYYSAPPEPAAAVELGAELAQRTRAFRDMLADAPGDEALWLRFIDFQERWRSAEAALAAADAAVARLPASRRLRAELHRARARALPPARRLQLLRAELGAAPRAALEPWLRLLDEAAGAGGAALDAALPAALAATRSVPHAYPHIFYIYGAYLRGAGLWEKLVLLLELVTSMNFPASAFPPSVDPQRLADVERNLLDFEDKALGSGLPRSTVWVRVERARAAARWRAPAGPAPPDPQRTPLAPDVAHLLLPVAPAAAPLLLLQALRLAKLPLLPAGAHVAAAAGALRGAAGEAGEGGEALLPLLRAARRLPRAHAARPACPALAGRLVAHFVDPPHYFTDDAGYLSWVSSLWDACCEWATGEWRVALLCWRLRWLHALLLLLDTQEESGRKEARRVRSAARAALKRFAGSSPLPYAQFARVEHAAAEHAAARRAALHALRAALQQSAPPAHCLYVARVLCELCDADGEAAGAWATACAALGRAPPPDPELRAPPPRALLLQALRQCEARCDELEAGGEPGAAAEDAGSAAGVLRALLPADAEWAAARARLAPAERRAELVRRVRGAARDCLCADAPAARYWEQSACALVTSAARDQRLAHYARSLAPLFPHNALLALASSGAPLWAWEKDTTQEERLAAMTGGARSHTAALAQLLPALLRAAGGAWLPRPAAALAAAASRAARAPAAPLLHAVLLEAAARAGPTRPAAALFAALDRHPQHKWLYVRGAACCAEAAAPLADVLLERQLRLHTLPDELDPPDERPS